MQRSSVFGFQAASTCQVSGQMTLNDFNRQSVFTANHPVSQLAIRESNFQILPSKLSSKLLTKRDTDSIFEARTEYM
jgi:hypothetical protein